ncbi:MAG: YceI family protein [Cyclobacteriaceae bacterium]|jgi:hypothetical protein|nr:YceI family protein [Cyclobacteriaceae bacterium]
MKLALLFATILLISASPVADRSNERWVVDASSELIIRGTSNVSNFLCRTDCYQIQDTLQIVARENDCEILFSQQALQIPLMSFNCGNELITRDFRDALDAERYPLLSIRFLSLDQQIMTLTSGSVSGHVQITLAGKTRTYPVLYTISGKGNTLTLAGARTVCFSDFSLQPPRKMMGLIRVQDEVDVEFQLHLQRI